MPGGVGVLLAMWTVHCLSALVSWTHLFLNDFDILYIIILSDLFITIILHTTFYFSRWPLRQRPCRYGLSRGLLGLEYDRIHISDSDTLNLTY